MFYWLAQLNRFVFRVQVAQHWSMLMALATFLSIKSLSLVLNQISKSEVFYEF
ncbi:hypothetical protein D029_2795 [Vibrio parahaemolyticus 970107]|nr:hypothetical protein D029_2795 [Vibrio parahaemolyticus 970107]